LFTALRINDHQRLLSSKLALPLGEGVYQFTGSGAACVALPVGSIRSIPDFGQQTTRSLGFNEKDF
jgi:hypothetical protein